MSPEPSEVDAVALQHARRGVALQVALRWVLVGFVALTVIAVPPPRFVGVCAARVLPTRLMFVSTARPAMRTSTAALRSSRS